MPGICLTKGLPSCRVSRELVGDMERYLRERTGALYERAGRKAAVTTQGLPEGQVQLFPDGIATIALTCSTGEIQDPQIAVRFDSKRKLALAWIVFDDASLQHAAQDILAGIVNIAASHRTRNRLYHSPIVWVFFALLWVGALAIQWPRLKLQVWDAALIGVTGAYFVLSRLLPFTMFETERNRRNEKWAARLRTGLLVGVLVALGYIAVRPLVE